MNVKISLISRPQFDPEAIVNFLGGNSTGWRRTAKATGPEEIVEIAGRVCYMSFGPRQSPRSNAEYVRNLLNQGHESVLEHVVWTFILEGISRAFSHELVRHRAGFAFSQLSQQYHDERAANAVEPSILLKFPDLHRAWQSSIQCSQETYATLLQRLESLRSNFSDPNDKKEINRFIHSAARSVLPNAIETKIVMSANARALRYFLKLRGTIAGDEEMRFVCAELLKIVKEEAPSLFSDFSTETLADGMPIIKQRENDETGE